ncbi:MAG: hypothetical protein HY533_00630 [Chloroflexi bacterium]|nr:hypothetical protein [Chloroflexota bacterium]
MGNSAGFLRILDLCVDRVLQDGEAVEACLRDHPQHAEQLEPILRLAQRTRLALEYTPRDAAKALARAELHRAIRERTADAQSGSPWESFQRALSRLLIARRWALMATTVALFVVLASTGAVAASSGSEADEPLYSVKRTVERARLALTRDDQDKARLHAAYADRRMEEMTAMASKGDRRRIKGLRGDVQSNLRHLRMAALPDQVILVAVPGGGWPDRRSGQTLPYAPRPLLIPPQGQRARELWDWQRTIQAHMQLIELRYRVALQEAPEPARAELREALDATRRDYQDLLFAFQQAYEARVDGASR